MLEEITVLPSINFTVACWRTNKPANRQRLFWRQIHSCGSRSFLPVFSSGLYTKCINECVTRRWSLSVRVFNFRNPQTDRSTGIHCREIQHLWIAKRLKWWMVTACLTELHTSEFGAWFGQCTVWRHTWRTVQLHAGHVPSLWKGAGAHFLGSAN